MDREKLAADLLWAERVIRFNAVHNAQHAEAAKRWLAELERSARRLHAASCQRRLTDS
jgi:hypothetical protein